VTEDEKGKIIAALNTKGAVRPCARCGHPQFSLVDGFFNQSLIQKIEELGVLTIGGPSIPSIMTACNRCGALSQHAMGVLGLLPPVINK